MIRTYLLKVNGDGMINGYYDIETYINGSISAYKDGRPSTLTLSLQQSLVSDEGKDIFSILNMANGRNQVLVVDDEDNTVIFFGLIDQYNINNEIGKITARSMDVAIYADKFESLMVLNYLLVNQISQTQQRFNIVDYIEAVKKQYGVFQISSNLQLSHNVSINMDEIQDLRLYNIDKEKDSVIYSRQLDVLRSFFVMNFDPSKIQNQPLIHLDEINKQLRLQKSNLYISPSSSYQLEQDQIGHLLIDRSIVIHDEQENANLSYFAKLYDIRRVNSYSSYSIDLRYNDISTMFYLQYTEDGQPKQQIIVNGQLRQLFGTKSEEIDLTDTSVYLFSDLYDLNDFQQYLSLSRYVKSRTITITNPSVDSIDLSQVYIFKIENRYYIPIKITSYNQQFDRNGIKISSISGNILLNKYMDKFLIDEDVVDEDFLLIENLKVGEGQ